MVLIESVTIRDEVCIYPSVAQLVERWTVEVIEIHRSLVQIRSEGENFYFFT